MNREIKFRAWDTKSKCWVDEVPYLKYLLDDKDAAISHHDLDELDSLFFYPSNPLPTDHNGRISYSQFTGLKDKNGKEIYEGDIVKYYYKTSHWDDEGDETKTVEYNDHFAGFLPFCNQYEQRDTYFEIVKVEIIGNIYENPELTK